MMVSRFAKCQCSNGGGTTAPGQNKVVVGPAVAPTLIDSAIKNGNLTLVTNPAVLASPTNVSGTAAECPNPNWTGTSTPC